MTDMRRGESIFELDPSFQVLLCIRGNVCVIRPFIYFY